MRGQLVAQKDPPLLLFHPQGEPPPRHRAIQSRGQHLRPQTIRLHLEHFDLGSKLAQLIRNAGQIIHQNHARRMTADG